MMIRSTRWLMVIGAAGALVLAAACQPLKAPPPPLEVTPPAPPESPQFTTPGATTFVVPAGICFVTVIADGGHGGAHGVTAGGAAATVTARVPVTPGTSLR